MLTTTLGASAGLAGYAGIYVVRDNTGRVAYVGQSRDVGRRLAQHKRGASAFGQSIRGTLGADDWRVSVLSVAECAQVTGRSCVDFDAAEAAMIETMGPAYNSQHNGGGSRPPILAESPGLREAILAIGRSRALCRRG